MNFNSTATPEQISHLRALRIRKTHSLDDEHIVSMSEESAECLIKICTGKINEKKLKMERGGS